MKEKFKINEKKISEVIEQYKKEKEDILEERKQEYKEKVIDLLGNEALKLAIDKVILEHYTQRLLDGEKIHDCYSNEDFFKMVEGLSNYEIVGDWQQFLTVNTEYLFKLPRNMQEKFAENFSIGNSDAKECLLTLWENNIETTGTDVIRPEVPASTNNITIKCYSPDMKYMIETLRQIITSTKYIYVSLCKCKNW